MMKDYMNRGRIHSQAAGLLDRTVRAADSDSVAWYEALHHQYAFRTL